MCGSIKVLLIVNSVDRGRWCLSLKEGQHTQTTLFEDTLWCLKFKDLSMMTPRNFVELTLVNILFRILIFMWSINGTNLLHLNRIK